MNDRPPLWTWAAAIGFAAVILVMMVLVVDYRKRAYLHLERLGTHDNRPLIVAIGSSQTYCGLEADGEMDSTLLAHGLAMRFMRISGSNMSFVDLVDLWKPLAAARPAVVIIEANTVRFRRSWPMDWRREIRERVAYRLPWASHASKPDENDPKAPTQCRPNWRFPASAAEYQADFAGWKATSPDELQDVIARIRDLQGRGTKVVVLDLPRSPRYQAWAPANLMRRGDRVLDQLMNETGVRILRDMPAFRPEQFADTGHLRPGGQKILSNWLATNLAQSLRRAP